LALIHHPDKGGDPEKFKAISVIHVILSDPEKRRLYDSNGELDGSELSEEAAHWYEYFRAMFPRVTTSAIDSFSKTYKGSPEERDDILREYEDKDGDFDSIMECIMLAEDEDEERIMTIIDEAIKSGEISSTTAYETHKKKFSKRKSSQCKNSTKSSEISGAATNSKKKHKAKVEDIENNEALEAMIRNRQKSAGDVLSNLMKKYGSGGDDVLEEDIPDDEFEAARARLGKGKSSSKSTGMNPKVKGGKR